MAWIFDPGKDPQEVPLLGRLETCPIGTWVLTDKKVWFFKTAKEGEKTWTRKNAPKHLQMEILLRGG